MLTEQMIKAIVPSSKESIVKPVVQYFNKYAKKYGITTYLRVCHFIAQAAHESAHFTVLEEFASGAAYEGRKDLGNVHKGDGKRYKGRGIFQLTGRANYRAMGARLGIDLENNPEMAEQPEISVLTALEYWTSRNLSQYADIDNVKIITKKINGGENGLDDRMRYLAKAKTVIPKNFRFDDKPVVVPKSDTPSEIKSVKRGDRGSDVVAIQKKLNSKGYKLVPDGIFGRQTELVVKDFQKKNALYMSGVVDVKTLKHLEG
jgi:putative chitinase